MCIRKLYLDFFLYKYCCRYALYIFERIIELNLNEIIRCYRGSVCRCVVRCFSLACLYYYWCINVLLSRISNLVFSLQRYIGESTIKSQNTELRGNFKK